MCPHLVSNKQCHMPVFTLAINLYWLMCTQVQIRAQGRALLCSRHAAGTREERMSVTGDFLQCDIISLLHHYCVGDIITDI